MIKLGVCAALRFVGAMVVCFSIGSNASAAVASDFSESFVALAKAAAERGDHRTAIKYYQKAIVRSQQTRAVNANSLLSSYAAIADNSAAIDFLKESSRRDPFTEMYPVELAKLYLKTGRAEEALTSVDVAEKLTSNSGLIWSLRGEALLAAGKYQQAVDVFTKISNADPKDFMSVVWRARAESALKQSDAAFADYQRAYRMRPNDIAISADYAKSALLLKRYDIVKIVATACIEADREALSCFESVGMAAIAQREFAAAIGHFQKAIAIRESVTGGVQLAEAYAYAGRIAESDQTFESFAAKYPHEESVLRSWVGFLEKRSALALAGEKLKAFYEKNPQSLWAASQLTRFYVLLEQSSEAIVVMKSALKVHGSDVARFYYAYALAADNRFEKAEDVLSEITNAALDAPGHITIVRQKSERSQRDPAATDGKKLAPTPEWKLPTT